MSNYKLHRDLIHKHAPWKPDFTGRILVSKDGNHSLWNSNGVFSFTWYNSAYSRMPLLFRWSLRREVDKANASHAWKELEND